eukprot:TRINITY_DN2274_c0_g1_i1.p1 TRINITY_DN2274_c0_g1~~TRINITY_DN2274_c0_g1_i1.p1  ORF type:complete len:166 (-),score=45.72 TRINITY_DN2274_c0_g1_i1:183-680(-)
MENLYNLIKKYKREDKTIWGCKYLKYSQQMYKYQDVPLFFSAERILMVYLAYITGVLPFIKIREDSLQGPISTAEYKALHMRYAPNGKGKLSVHLHHALVDILNKLAPPLFKHLQDRGILVIQWVLNTPEDIELALQSGVNGIMTDSPTVLKEVLQRKGKLIPNA